MSILVCEHGGTIVETFHGKIRVAERDGELVGPVCDCPPEVLIVRLVDEADSPVRK